MKSISTRRAFVLTIATLTAPSFVLAQGTTPETGDPLTVELSGIALPVVSNNVFVNYLFGTIKIQMGDAGSTFFLRENSFLLRDAIIKIASRAPIPMGPTRGSFDRVAVTRIVLQAIQAVRPSARVVRVTVESAAFMRN
jgi:hypothetical protein